MFIEKDFLSAGKNEEEYEKEFDEYYTKTYNSQKQLFDMLLENGIAPENEIGFNDALEKSKMDARYNFMVEKNREYFIRFFSTIESLLELAAASIETEMKENFIDLYLKWQKYELSVEACVDKMPEGSRATWYRCVESFEKCPIYEEYMICYKPDRYAKPKKGRVPDKYELLLYYKEVYHLTKQITVPYNAIERYIYENCKGIHALKDVYRCINAADHSIEVLKNGNKKKLDAELSQRGITLSDLDFDEYSYEKMIKKREKSKKRLDSMKDIVTQISQGISLDKNMLEQIRNM